jgi:hypothetical protein
MFNAGPGTIGWWRRLMLKTSRISLADIDWTRSVGAVVCSFSLRKAWLLRKLSLEIQRLASWGSLLYCARADLRDVSVNHWAMGNMPRNSSIISGSIVLVCIISSLSYFTHTFGDNQSVVNSSSFHRVRKAIAAKLTTFNLIVSGADILSKDWNYSKVWQFLKPILFWGGERYYGGSRQWVFQSLKSPAPLLTDGES